MDIKYNHTYFHAYYKEVLLFHKIKTYISVDPAEDAIICAMLKNEIDEIKMTHSWFELNANVFRSPSKGHFAVLLEKVSVLDELLRLNLQLLQIPNNHECLYGLGKVYVHRSILFANYRRSYGNTLTSPPPLHRRLVNTMSAMSKSVFDYLQFECYINYIRQVITSDSASAFNKADLLDALKFCCTVSVCDCDNNENMVKSDVMREACLNYLYYYLDDGPLLKWIGRRYYKDKILFSNESEDVKTAKLLAQRVATTPAVAIDRCPKLEAHPTYSKNKDIIYQSCVEYLKTRFYTEIKKNSHFLYKDTIYIKYIV